MHGLFKRNDGDAEPRSLDEVALNRVQPFGVRTRGSRAGEGRSAGRCHADLEPENAAGIVIGGRVESASRPLPPGTCTSAAPGPRSSTGSTRVGTAARSSCASRTPTSSGRPRRWSPASSTGCAGSASTGTRARTWAARTAPYFQSERLARYRALGEAGGVGPRLLLLLPAEELKAAARRRRRRRRRLAVRPNLRAALPTSARREAAGTPARRPLRVPPGAHAFDDLVHGGSSSTTR
jgi:hypothetical protein